MLCLYLPHKALSALELYCIAHSENVDLYCSRNDGTRAELYWIYRLRRCSVWETRQHLRGPSNDNSFETILTRD